MRMALSGADRSAATISSRAAGLQGMEGRADWTGLTKTHAGSVVSLLTGATFPSQITFNNDFLASATARLGHTFADRWLVFVRGGAAWARGKADDAFTAAA